MVFSACSRGIILGFAALFIGSLVATVIIVPWILIKMPADYFSHDAEHRQPFSDYPAALRLPLLLAKNLLGLGLVAMGVAMLVLPGQGVIVILIGVFLLDFPGKKHIERWLISRGPILNFANWLRGKWRKAPLTLD
jgi:hypothetical protein